MAIPCSPVPNRCTLPFSCTTINPSTPSKCRSFAARGCVAPSEMIRNQTKCSFSNPSQTFNVSSSQKVQNSRPSISPVLLPYLSKHRATITSERLSLNSPSVITCIVLRRSERKTSGQFSVLFPLGAPVFSPYSFSNYQVSSPPRLVSSWKDTTQSADNKNKRKRGRNGAPLSHGNTSDSLPELRLTSSLSSGSFVDTSAKKRHSTWQIHAVSSEALAAEWTPSLSYEQVVQLQAQEEESRLFRNGPPSGDLAEVEAFCRIHRLAELLHSAVMNSLRTLKTARAALSDDGDIPLLEEKVVAGLARMGAVLQQGRLEVLGGRHMVNTGEVLPPLARMRAELKDACEALQQALESCIFPSLIPELIHRPLQQLHNICLDAGFPRLPGAPSHADIPNLAAVKLRPFRTGFSLDQDEEIAFWRGGQVTEEGVEWLLQQGFRVIVDMRAEQAGSPFAQSLLEAAQRANKLHIIKMPVPFRTAPTREQVEEFAKLVDNSENKPLYLHSQGGVGRACAMVSRWREFVLHRGTEKETLGDSSLLSDEDMGLEREKNVEGGGAAVYSSNLHDNTSGISKESMSVPNNRKPKRVSVHQASIVVDGSDTRGSILEDAVQIEENLSNLSEDVLRNGTEASQREGSSEDQGKKDSVVRLTSNPFEAQRPEPNVFSKKTMSKFMKRRKTTPKEAGPNNGLNNLATATARRDQIGVIAGPAGRWGLAGPGIPRAGRFESRENTNSTSSERRNDDSEFLTQSAAEKGSHDQEIGTEGVEAQERVSKGEAKNGSSNGTLIESAHSQRRGQKPEQQESVAAVQLPVKKNGALFRVDSEPGVQGSSEDAPPVVDGDMCASTTGVVRIQSRRKAEMYLVRTDGFSCTRERVKESTLAFTHPSTQQQMLMWKTAPKTVLLLKKLGDDLMIQAQQVASFLFHQEGMNVMVEPDLHDAFARMPGFGFVQTFYNQDTSVLHERVDFVICLGGDGVILHASNLFREAVPPVISFNLGSLGFLTAHPYEEFKQDLRAIIYGNSGMDGVYITLRMRLRCELFRNGKPIPGKVFDVLNEVVVDRGSNPYLCKIECYERSRLITKVQADGVIVATPTGSTAYSTAAGGSMVHPNVPCMLFTPICPHSLSFRPVILPDSALLELKVPDDARSNAWVSFDGKKRQQLCKGESMRIRMSEHPMPTVNKHDQTDDWFGSLSRCFGWNQRIEQRSFSVPP